MKLSDKQKEVIQKLRNGEICYYLVGIDSRCFFARYNVPWPTIYKLEKLKLVHRPLKTVELTELGKTIEL